MKQSPPTGSAVRRPVGHRRSAPEATGAGGTGGATGARREHRPERPEHTTHPPTGHPPDSSSLSWSFPGTPADVSHSRRWLAAAVTEIWGEGEDADRLLLAYSELATNAVVHGTGPVSVAAHIDATGAHCEIADRSPSVPTARHAAPDEVGGRGLDLVRATVDRLRVVADGIGKTVSFAVGRRDRPRPTAG
ncbi:MAG: ATP-binding protein [Catenulispora sp.]